MIPLEFENAAVPGRISITLPSRKRPHLLKKTVESLRETAHDPDSLEFLVAYDPDDPGTGEVAQELGVDYTWESPERYGYSGIAAYYVHLLNKSSGEWLFPTWGDDAVMVTQGWDDSLRAQSPGTIAYIQGNLVGMTCFPAVHADALRKIGRYCPLPAVDTWYEEVGRLAGKLVHPDIYVRQDRPDINGQNNDATHSEGGAAWREVHHHYDQPYYREPYTTWRQEDADRLRS